MPALLLPRMLTFREYPSWEIRTPASRLIGAVRSGFERLNGVQSIIYQPGGTFYTTVGHIPAQRLVTVTKEMSQRFQGMGYRNPLTNDFVAATENQSLNPSKGAQPEFAGWSVVELQ